MARTKRAKKPIYEPIVKLPPLSPEETRGERFDCRLRRVAADPGGLRRADAAASSTVIIRSR